MLTFNCTDNGWGKSSPEEFLQELETDWERYFCDIVQGRLSPHESHGAFSPIWPDGSPNF